MPALNQRMRSKAAAQPKQPPLLYDQTQKIIKQIKALTGNEVICYWTSTQGSICPNDVVALYETLEKIGPLAKTGLFLKSSGGSVQAALRIVNLLREYCSEIVAYLPLECASAATMISLCADEIHMGPLAHLTAIDSALYHDLSPIDQRENRRVSVSLDELSRLVKLWEASAKEHHDNPYSELFKYIHPLVIGAIDRSSSLSIKICKEILSYHLADEEACERLSVHLNSNYPSHNYPITMREAARIGLKVRPLSKEVNKLLLDLNEIYSEMTQRAITDFDEWNLHDNEILNVLEADDIQVYFQNDKDLNYIKDERRWQTLNDNSSWRKIETVKKQKVHSVLHIR